ncbi:16039_t:CDS:2, partial [Racocetra persica]
ENPFISSYEIYADTSYRKDANTNKLDFWTFLKIAETIQEILYEEISGSPFKIIRLSFDRITEAILEVRDFVDILNFCTER